ncbi:PROTEIN DETOXIFICATION [Salix koriyanagi]|uniref:Protein DETOXIFICATION n=1 Tax=Salix koriyanagi TaxID=2511006 RepID=A0A9Q0UMU8_9ROSI|nr:PROTEIN DETOXIFICATION [Salix koriyanagi]
MNDQGISASIPLLGHYKSRLPLGSDKDFLPEKQEYSLPCEDQAWRPSLSQVVAEIKELCTIAFPMIITGLLIYGKSAISMLFHGEIRKRGFSRRVSLHWHSKHHWLLYHFRFSSGHGGHLLASLWSQAMASHGTDPSANDNDSHLGMHTHISSLAQTLNQSSSSVARTEPSLPLPPLTFAAFSLALHFPISYILAHRFSLGIRGIAVAVAITDLNLLAALLLYLYFSGICRKSWQGWSLQCFDEWRPILSLAIPSCISVCLEWWWYELMIVLSGILSNAPEAVATMGILIQATSLVYIFPSALSLAVSTRVGNELGANQPNKAKMSSIIALSCAVLMSIIAMLFMTLMRHAWGQIFTTDKAILSLIATAMPVVGLCELGNCPQTTGCGVLRGSARPTLGANINLGSFYGVGLPIAILMGIAMGLGLLGFWFGLLVAQAVCAIVMVVVLTRTDWKVQAKSSQRAYWY